MRKGCLRVWWGAGLALLLARLLAPAFAGEGWQAGLTTLLVLWALPSGALLLVWAWRRLTYRIGVRLFLSYLLIGVTPLLLTAAVAGIGGYVLLGQYTSVRFSGLLGESRADLERRLDLALLAAEAEGPAAAARVLEEQGRRGAGALPPGLWLLTDSQETWRSPGADGLSVPLWAAEGVTSGPFFTAQGPALAAIARRGELLAAVVVPLDEEASRLLTEGRWFEASFRVGTVTEDERNLELKMRDDDEGGQATDDGAAGAGEPTPPAARKGLWHRRWILFLSLSDTPTTWEDGTAVAGQAVITVLRTSPAEAVEDLFRSPYRLGSRLIAIFGALCVLFAGLYLVVISLAAAQIFSVTRAAARLTRGTRQVEAGALDHRIPVRRRDQLGDLAASFNRMTESVEGMLAQVREKERLARELELAREIQESLLPRRHLRHGGMEVRAVFRPAAEVGGDYFDVFPLSPEHLLVTIGDVAGHGLSTGLLMAMVKSAVATLIRDGHRGAALLERLNGFMREQGRGHRMLTLALVDVDVGAGSATITSAGHPGGFLLAPGGDVREILLSGLPVGTRWRRPPAEERVAFPPGSRLLLFSDGLVEAQGAAGEAFGFDRLQTLLGEVAALSSEALLARIVARFDEHLGGEPAEDDLTLVLVDRAAGEGDASGEAGQPGGPEDAPGRDEEPPVPEPAG